MKKILIIAAVLAAVSVAVFRMAGRHRTEEDVAQQGLNRVSVGEVLPREIRRKLDFDGVVTAVNEALVFSDVPGIVSRHVKNPGDPVRKDEAVLLLDRSDIGLDYAPAEVRAPVDGRVLDILVDKGSRVGPGQPLALVGDTDMLEVRIDVSPGDSAYMRTGLQASVTVSARPGMSFRGEVSRVSAALDSRSRKVPVRIRVANRGGHLMPGMVCVADVTVESVNHLSVRNSALLLRNGETGVFLVGEDDVVEWEEVEVVLRGREYTAVNGLERGSVVAVSGNYGLMPGSRVRIEER